MLIVMAGQKKMLIILNTEGNNLQKLSEIYAEDKHRRNRMEESS